jgi:hypothetical protein
MLRVLAIALLPLAVLVAVGATWAIVGEVRGESELAMILYVFPCLLFVSVIGALLIGLKLWSK